MNQVSAKIQRIEDENTKRRTRDDASSSQAINDRFPSSRSRAGSKKSKERRNLVSLRGREIDMKLTAVAFLSTEPGPEEHPRPFGVLLLEYSDDLPKEKPRIVYQPYAHDTGASAKCFGEKEELLSLDGGRRGTVLIVEHNVEEPPLIPLRLVADHERFQVTCPGSR